MNSLRKLWKSGIFGKIVIAGISLFTFCCLCSIPVAVFSPSSPSSTQTNKISRPATTQTSMPTETLEPTATTMPTKTSEAETNGLPSPIPTLTDGQTAVVGVSCIPSNSPQTGIVVDVVDGDTIKVLLDDDGKTYTVRYIGMDTPESTTEIEFWGPEASIRNAQLVFGKQASLIRVSKTVGSRNP